MELDGVRTHDHQSHNLALYQLSYKLHINSRWIRTTTSRTEIWHATNYTMELFILLVAPEGIEPSLTGPKPVVLPLYHRASWVREVGLEPTKSSDSGFTVHPRCHWSTPEFSSGASWSRTTFSGFSVPRIHQVCQSSLLMLPQMESNHHLQIQNLPHYRYAIGQVCGG